MSEIEDLGRALSIWNSGKTSRVDAKNLQNAFSLGQVEENFPELIKSLKVPSLHKKCTLVCPARSKVFLPNLLTWLRRLSCDGFWRGTPCWISRVRVRNCFIHFNKAESLLPFLKRLFTLFGSFFSETVHAAARLVVCIRPKWRHVYVKFYTWFFFVVVFL